ncbi:MAG: DNA repair protein RecO [Patescibacteria group bacterium]|jgi:DNA repair protein RecO (recombination protein O)|nr:DNA repair protein RecO [Patescibacteria group bacterium]
MDSTFPSKAIILQRQAWREADRLVSVYTPEFGRLFLVARGARKLNSKLAAHLEPLSISQLLIIKGRGQNYVASAVIDKALLNIKSDLNKLYFAGQALAFFNSLVKTGEKDLELFNYLEKWLISLDQAQYQGSFNKDEGRFRLALFYWRVLSFLGYGLSLDSCVACQKQIMKGGNNKLNFVQGGLLCPICQANIKENNYQSSYSVSDNCIKWLRYLNREVEPNLKAIKISHKLLKEWEYLHEKRMTWLDL